MEKVMNKDVAVYGGSFSPPTMGHYHMIEKATKIFDVVYVVLATNPDKNKSEFTVKERLAMLKDMAHIIDPTDTKIEVVMLPTHTYLADFAYQKGAKFLIRGIRDQLDFKYEQDIYRTNRLIHPEVETIYLMPSDAYSLVSSSWVRSLVGCHGWTKVIEKAVTPYVLNELKRKYLKGQFMELLKDPRFANIMRFDHETIWQTIEEGYDNKNYHGYDHLVFLLEAMEKNLEQPDPVMKYALFFHDVDPSEEKSAAKAISFMRMLSKTLEGEDIKDRIVRLIMATKHDKCEYEKEDEQIIASLDLLVLASKCCSYNDYVRKVFLEYCKESGLDEYNFSLLWNPKRAEFLKKMLARKVILPWNKLNHLDPIARENMSSELDSLEKEILMIN